VEDITLHDNEGGELRITTIRGVPALVMPTEQPGFCFNDRSHIGLMLQRLKDIDKQLERKETQ
jgi:hypothetical protein